MSNQGIQPIQGLAKRQMRMIYLVDCSGSMSIDGKMDTLNIAMAKAQGEIRKVAEGNPQANVMVQTLRFSSGASWTTPEPVPVSSFQWQTMQADELDRTDPGWAREMRQQLVAAGAHGGKFKIGLQWFDRNDLDLHVVCPHGHEIYYGSKESPCCGGWLDVDMNVKGETDSPLEHIVFGHTESGATRDLAPGDYKISVVYYSKYAGASSDFRVIVDFDDQPYSNYEETISTRTKTKIIDTITVADDGSIGGAGGTVPGGTGPGGNTDLGAAFVCLGEALKSPPHPRRAIPPLVVLLSDGEPTDDFEGPLAALDSLGWAQKAQRFAIAIGRDADPEVLTKFTGDRNKVLDANNPERLATLIQWCSTQVLQSSLTAGGEGSGPASFMPPPPPPGSGSSDGAGDVSW